MLREMLELTTPQAVFAFHQDFKGALWYSRTGFTIEENGYTTRKLERCSGVLKKCSCWHTQCVFIMSRPDHEMMTQVSGRCSFGKMLFSAFLQTPQGREVSCTFPGCKGEPSALKPDTWWCFPAKCILPIIVHITLGHLRELLIKRY